MTGLPAYLRDKCEANMVCGPILETEQRAMARVKHQIEFLRQKLRKVKK